MLRFLKFKNCQDVVMRAKTASNDKTGDEKYVHAINYIYSAISNNHLVEIIQKFDQLKKSTALQIVCRYNLENIKLNNYSDVNEYFNDFEKAINELKQAGANVTEQEKLIYMYVEIITTKLQSCR